MLGVIVLLTYQYAASQSDDNPIKVKTVLLNVPVIVSDKDGRHVPGMRKEHFKVTIGDAEREIDYFSDTESSVSVAIVLDITGSVSGVISGIKKAAKDFVTQLGLNDQCMVVTFGEEIKILQPFTSDKERLRKKISNARRIPGGTALMNEALRFVLKYQSSIKGRKAIILITDAGEINFATTERLMNDLIEADVVVYPIYFPTAMPGLPRGKSVPLSTLIEETPVGNLVDIAKETGGRFFVAQGDDFRARFQTIMEDLKKMYVIGFHIDPDTERMRRINLGLDRGGAFLRTKRTIRWKTPSESVPQ